MKLVKTALVVLLTLASVSPADACFFRRRARCYSARRQANYRPVYRVPAASPPAFRSVPAAAPAAYATPQSGNPLAAVNAVRARYGLGAIAYDPALAATARANSSHGIVDHFHHWRGFEAVAGGTDVNGALSMWLGSKLHRDVLLSPTATAGAIEMVGTIITLDVR